MASGLGELNFPPDYPKMPGEPPRVQPSKRRKDREDEEYMAPKVERDARMVELDREHPQYGWADNKGYSASAHLDALTAHGACVQHRRSWALPGVGVIALLHTVADNGWTLLLAIGIGTPLTMALTGRLAQAVLRRWG